MWEHSPIYQGFALLAIKAFSQLNLFCFPFPEPVKPRIVRPDKPRTIPPRHVGPVNSTIGDNVTALTDSDVTINCPAIGLPKPRFMWSKDGEKISLGNKYLVLENGALVIRKVSVDESGAYRCTVENIVGKDSRDTKLNVIGKFCLHFHQLALFIFVWQSGNCVNTENIFYYYYY